MTAIERPSSVRPAPANSATVSRATSARGTPRAPATGRAARLRRASRPGGRRDDDGRPGRRSARSAAADVSGRRTPRGGPPATAPRRRRRRAGGSDDHRADHRERAPPTMKRIDQYMPRHTEVAAGWSVGDRVLAERAARTTRAGSDAERPEATTAATRRVASHARHLIRIGAGGKAGTASGRSTTPGHRDVEPDREGPARDPPVPVVAPPQAQVERPQHERHDHHGQDRVRDQDREVDACGRAPGP